MLCHAAPAGRAAVHAQPCRYNPPPQLPPPSLSPAVYVINTTLHEHVAAALAGKECSPTLGEAIRWAVMVGRFKAVHAAGMGAGAEHVAAELQPNHLLPICLLAALVALAAQRPRRPRALHGAADQLCAAGAGAGAGAGVSTAWQGGLHACSNAFRLQHPGSLPINPAPIPPALLPCTLPPGPSINPQGAPC